MQVGATEQTVQVTDVAPLIDTTTVLKAQNISAEEFENLPKTRSFQSLAVLSPSVNTGTIEGGWLPVRDCYRAGNLPGVPPVSSNEPIGAGSSVSSESDPIKLCAAAGSVFFISRSWVRPSTTAMMLFR